MHNLLDPALESILTELQHSKSLCTKGQVFGTAPGMDTIDSGIDDLESGMSVTALDMSASTPDKTASIHGMSTTVPGVRALFHGMPEIDLGMSSLLVESIDSDIELNNRSICYGGLEGSAMALSGSGKIESKDSGGEDLSHGMDALGLGVLATGPNMPAIAPGMIDQAFKLHEQCDCNKVIDFQEIPQDESVPPLYTTFTLLDPEQHNVGVAEHHAQDGATITHIQTENPERLNKTTLPQSQSAELSVEQSKVAANLDQPVFKPTALTVSTQGDAVLVAADEYGDEYEGKAAADEYKGDGDYQNIADDAEYENAAATVAQCEDEYQDENDAQTQFAQLSLCAYPEHLAHLDQACSKEPADATALDEKSVNLPPLPIARIHPAPKLDPETQAAAQANSFTLQLSSPQLEPQHAVSDASPKAWVEERSTHEDAVTHDAATAVALDAKTVDPVNSEALDEVTDDFADKTAQSALSEQSWNDAHASTASSSLASPYSSLSAAAASSYERGDPSDAITSLDFHQSVTAGPLHHLPHSFCLNTKLYELVVNKLPHSRHYYHSTGYDNIAQGSRPNAKDSLQHENPTLDPQSLLNSAHANTNLPEELKKMAQRLGVFVMMYGQQAFTDGKYVVLPQLDMDQPLALLTAKALLAHEVGHVWYSDFSVANNQQSEIFNIVFNALEDARIDFLMLQWSPECKESLNFFNSTLFNYHLLSDLSTYPKFKILCCFFMSASHMTLNCTLDAEQLVQRLQFELSNLIKATGSEQLLKVIAKIKDCHSSLDVFHVTEQLYALLSQPDFFVPNYSRFAQHFRLTDTFDQQNCLTLAQMHRQQFIAPDEEADFEVEFDEGFPNFSLFLSLELEFSELNTWFKYQAGNDSSPPAPPHSGDTAPRATSDQAAQAETESTFYATPYAGDQAHKDSLESTDALDNTATSEISSGRPNNEPAPDLASSQSKPPYDLHHLLSSTAATPDKPKSNAAATTAPAQPTHGSESLTSSSPDHTAKSESFAGSEHKSPLTLEQSSIYQTVNAAYDLRVQGLHRPTQAASKLEPTEPPPKSGATPDPSSASTTATIAITAEASTSAAADPAKPGDAKSIAPGSAQPEALALATTITATSITPGAATSEATTTDETLLTSGASPLASFTTPYTLTQASYSNEDVAVQDLPEPVENEPSASYLQAPFTNSTAQTLQDKTGETAATDQTQSATATTTHLESSGDLAKQPYSSLMQSYTTSSSLYYGLSDKEDEVSQSHLENSLEPSKAALATAQAEHVQTQVESPEHVVNQAYAATSEHQTHQIHQAHSDNPATPDKTAKPRKPKGNPYANQQANPAFWDEQTWDDIAVLNDSLTLWTALKAYPNFNRLFAQIFWITRNEVALNCVLCAYRDTQDKPKLFELITLLFEEAHAADLWKLFILDPYMYHPALEVWYQGRLKRAERPDQLYLSELKQQSAQMAFLKDWYQHQTKSLQSSALGKEKDHEAKLMRCQLIFKQQSQALKQRHEENMELMEDIRKAIVIQNAFRDNLAYLQQPHLLEQNQAQPGIQGIFQENTPVNMQAWGLTQAEQINEDLDSEYRLQVYTKRQFERYMRRITILQERGWFFPLDLHPLPCLDPRHYLYNGKQYYHHTLAICPELMAQFPELQAKDDADAGSSSLDQPAGNSNSPLVHHILLKSLDAPAQLQETLAYTKISADEYNSVYFPQAEAKAREEKEVAKHAPRKFNVLRAIKSVLGLKTLSLSYRDKNTDSIQILKQTLKEEKRESVHHSLQFFDPKHVCIDLSEQLIRQIENTPPRAEIDVVKSKLLKRRNKLIQQQHLQKVYLEQSEAINLQKPEPEADPELPAIKQPATTQSDNSQDIAANLASDLQPELPATLRSQIPITAKIAPSDLGTQILEATKDPSTLPAADNLSPVTKSADAQTDARVNDQTHVQANTHTAGNLHPMSQPTANAERQRILDFRQRRRRQLLRDQWRRVEAAKQQNQQDSHP